MFSKLKKAVIGLGLGKQAIVGAAMVGGAVAPVYAALPASAEAVFTTVATDFATVLGYAYVLMAAVTVGMIVLGIVQKLAKKSSK